MRDYFQVAVDFLTENGVYCAENHRVIKIAARENLPEGAKVRKSPAYRMRLIY